MSLQRSTGLQAAMHVLSEAGVEIVQTGLHEIHRHSGALFDRLRHGRPAVVIVHARNAESLDVMALRWMFRGGVTPLVLCPSEPVECVELAAIAARAAQLLGAPAFLLLEDEVAAGELGAAGAPSFRDDTDKLSIDEPEAAENAPDDEPELSILHARHARPLRGINAVKAESGAAEWLLLSYGATAKAASVAAAMARESGQRVRLARVRMLWPLPEEQLLKAALGAKHVVVAERNLGQYALEVRRVLPELPVISAGAPRAPVPAQVILSRLQRSPRCC
jgi:pyruvate/2-oxoacid:ferredoxin oxidoreductase alpha subunit